ncbi:MAG: ABC transporter permease [Pseudomonadota bacterium]
MMRLILGGFIVTGLLALAALSLVWSPHDVTVFNIPGRFSGSSQSHWLGTDQYGRDVLSMILNGAATAVFVAIAAIAIGMTIGVALGLAAALGGWKDSVLTRVNDVIFSFPGVLVAVLLTASLGPGLLTAVLAIGVFNIPVFGQLTRSAARSLWQRDFILSARAVGKGPWRISFDHILPNLISLIAVQASIQISLAIAAEAALSYIGLGAQPPTASWGRMLSESQTLFAFRPALMIYPGAAIALAVLGFSLLGDGLRTLLDPAK